ncbi:MAG: hypothetical protein ACI9KE_000064 [Polyangiales bacterium]
MPVGVVVYDGYQGELDKDVERWRSALARRRRSAQGEDARGADTAGSYES